MSQQGRGQRNKYRMRPVPGQASAFFRKITSRRFNGLREKCNREFFRALVGQSRVANEHGGAGPNVLLSSLTCTLKVI